MSLKFVHSHLMLIHIRTRLHTCIYECTHSHIHTLTHLHTYESMSTNTHISPKSVQVQTLGTYMHIFTTTHTYSNVHTPERTHTHTSTQELTHICPVVQAQLEHHYTHIPCLSITIQNTPMAKFQDVTLLPPFKKFRPRN